MLTSARAETRAPAKLQGRANAMLAASPLHVGIGLFVVCLAAFADLWLPVPNDAATTSTHRMRSAGETHQYHYLLRAPKSGPPPDGWPLIVFLHGVMECGDPQLSKLTGQGPLSPMHRLGLAMPHVTEAVVAAPQAPCSAGGWFEARAVKLFVDEVVEIHRIDPRRIYLTGVASGLTRGAGAGLRTAPDGLASPPSGLGSLLLAPGRRPVRAAAAWAPGVGPVAR